LLSDKSRAEFHKWVETSRPGLEYGFCVGKANGWIGHTGDLPGFASFLGYLPETDTTLVVLTNLSNNKDGTSPAERLRDVVIRERKLLGEQP
jgi:D-alanyl-D-alanine carboxypeptidase